MGLNKQKRLFTISQSAFLLYDQKKLSKKMCLSTWYTFVFISQLLLNEKKYAFYIFSAVVGLNLMQR